MEVSDGIFKQVREYYQSQNGNKNQEGSNLTTPNLHEILKSPSRKYK